MRDMDKAVMNETMKLKNTFYMLNRLKALKIGYFGGSITEGAGATDMDKTSWRALTGAWFRKNYSNCEIKEIQAAIGGTGSDLGLFRCERDLISHMPDLIFIEFAVNDSGISRDRILYSIEGIVRKIWEANPYADIVFVYTITRSLAASLENGTEFNAKSIHMEIANYYMIPSVDAGQKLLKKIHSGFGVWESYTVDNVHPSDEGHSIYAEAIQNILRENLVPGDELFPRTLGKPFNCPSIVKSCLADAWEVKQEGWTRFEQSMAGVYPHMLSCNEPGTVLKYEFSGTIIGIYWLIAPDSGDIEWSVDGSEPTRVSSWDKYACRFSRAHYYIFIEDLNPGLHLFKLRILYEKQPESSGTWIRIGAFLVGEKA